MKILIAEDDPTSRLLLGDILKRYGPVDTAENGRQAVDAFEMAFDAGEPYDLVCLDIMMPNVDGYQALSEIRAIEESRGITSTRGTKVLMTTALNRVENVAQGYYTLCDAYLVKPIDKPKLLEALYDCRLI